MLLNGAWLKLLSDSVRLMHQLRLSIAHRAPDRANSTSPVPDDDHKACTFFRQALQGRVGKAVANLGSLGIAPLTDTTIAELRTLLQGPYPLTPTFPGVGVDWRAHMEPTPLSEPLLRKVVSSRDKYTAAGTTGERPTFNQLFLADLDGWADYYWFCDALANASLSSRLVSLLSYERLVALRKKKGSDSLASLMKLVGLSAQLCADSTVKPALWTSVPPLSLWMVADRMIWPNSSRHSQTHTLIMLLHDWTP